MKRLAALGALIVASSAAWAQVTLADLAGRWEVVGVELRAATVQTLTADDSDYMGSVLDVSGQRVIFVVRKGGDLDDSCIGPRWNGAMISCVVGNFGPPGAMVVYLGDQLRLEWYENAILVLQRVR